MEKITVYTHPTSPVTEAYRALCLNVLASSKGKKLIEVSGVNADMNASVVVANLATAMAQVGKHTLLLDCNLRNPKQHILFGLPNKGITDCFIAAGSFTDFVQQTAQHNLQVLTAGDVVPNPAEILLGVDMQNMLSEFKAVYDIVLIDVPAIGDVVDAAALGTKTDGVLLVLTNKADTMKQACKAKEVLTQAGVPILGCVLNKA